MISFDPSAWSHSEDSQRRQMWDIESWFGGISHVAQRVCVVLSAADREQLAAIAADRNRPRKHVERAHRARLGGSAIGAAGGAQRLG